MRRVFGGRLRTFICGRSTPESSFMLSATARVINAFASRVARATCAGVVYDDMPVVRVSTHAGMQAHRTHR